MLVKLSKRLSELKISYGLEARASCALIVGLRAARKLNQRDVAYELVCRLASLTTDPVEKAEYIAYSGLLLDEAVVAESMAHWQAACELNPECVTARFNIEQRLGRHSDTTLLYLAERAAKRGGPHRAIYLLRAVHGGMQKKKATPLIGRWCFGLKCHASD